MSGSYQQLRRTARLSAYSRGHFLKPFRKDSENNGCIRATSSCNHCGMEVQVITKPAPNEIGIAGEAVALKCQKLPNHITKEQMKSVREYTATLPIWADGDKMPGATDYRGAAGDPRRKWAGFDWHKTDNHDNCWSRCSPDYEEILLRILPAQAAH